MNSNILISLQTVAIYLLIIVAIRIFGKKELAQLSIIDLVFVLLISNSVQNAMVGNADDFRKGLYSAGSLFAVNFILKKIMFKSKEGTDLIEGEPITLIYKGKVISSSLKATQISINELEAAIREHGIEKITDVDLAILEVDGNVSVLSNEFTKHSLKFHKILRKQEA